MKVLTKKDNEKLKLVYRLRHLISSNQHQFINKVKTAKQNKAVYLKSYQEMLDTANELEKQIRS